MRQLALVTALGACLAGSAASAPSSLARYVATWAPSYRAFELAYVKAFRPCLLGRPTPVCAAAQDHTAAAAAKTAALLQASAPPPELAEDVAALAKDLRAADHRFSLSATAGRAGKTTPKVWCSAEQGPCTLVMIDMGNVISDINFTAGVDLPLPG
jgi:methylphosphotriester-DNA--protein-cysteine methyltransferase